MTNEELYQQHCKIHGKDAVLKNTFMRRLKTGWDPIVAVATGHAKGNQKLKQKTWQELYQEKKADVEREFKETRKAVAEKEEAELPSPEPRRTRVSRRHIMSDKELLRITVDKYERAREKDRKIKITMFIIIIVILLGIVIF